MFTQKNHNSLKYSHQIKKTSDSAKDLLNWQPFCDCWQIPDKNPQRLINHVCFYLRGVTVILIQSKNAERRASDKHDSSFVIDPSSPSSRDHSFVIQPFSPWPLVPYLVCTQEGLTVTASLTSSNTQQCTATPESGINWRHQLLTV